MNKAVCKCLLDMTDRERTLPVLTGRILGIKADLNRAAGVLRSLSAEKFQRNPRYYQSLLTGWQEHIVTLANELAVLHAELVRNLSKRA